MIYSKQEPILTILKRIDLINNSNKSQAGANSMKKIITLAILVSILATHFTSTQALDYKTKMYLGFGTAVVGGVSGAAAAIYFYNKAHK